MHHIIYLSHATRNFTTPELTCLLEQARSYNESRDITGALVYANRQFMQVIEGEEAVIRALYGRICADPRHRALFKLADKAIAERTFSDWTMAFRPLSPEEFTSLDGYVAPSQWEQITFGNNRVTMPLLNHLHDLILVGNKQLAY